MTELINQLEAELNKLGAAWNIFGMVDKLKSIVAKMKRSSTIPDGWIVFELGQTPVFNLWFCHLLNAEDLKNGAKTPRHIFVEEQDTMEDAIFYACEQVRLSKPTTITIETIS